MGNDIDLSEDETDIDPDDLTARDVTLAVNGESVEVTDFTYTAPDPEDHIDAIQTAAEEARRNRTYSGSFTIHPSDEMAKQLFEAAAVTTDAEEAKEQFKEAVADSIEVTESVFSDE